MFNSEEEIIFKHLANKDEIVLALKIVDQYILDNQLLITGGLALDYALQTKNRVLYDEYTFPDYDVLCNDPVKHCNDLAMILCTKHNMDVDVVQAIHNTTLRVKVYSYTVFDCTYVPFYLLEKIPYMNYQNYKILNPHFLMVYQYLSLASLFSMTGKAFNYEHRLEKDYTRNLIIQTYFPYKYLYNIPIEPSTQLFTIKIPMQIFSFKDDVYYKTNIDKLNNINDYKDGWFFTNNNICCGPILSFILLSLKSKTSFIYKLLDLKIEDNNLILKLKNKELIKLYDSQLFNLDFLINEDYDSNLNNIKKILNESNVENIKSISDLFPKSTIINKFKFYDISTKNITLDIIKYNGYNFLICSPYYSLTYFLIQYYLTNNDIFNLFYSYCFNLKYLCISSFENTNLTEEQLYYINLIENREEHKILKPNRHFLKKESCIIKNKYDFDYNKSYFYD